MRSKYTFSLFVAGLNEFEHLRAVLEYYSGIIDDVCYFDLNSNDESLNFARSLKDCNVYKVDPEPTIEILHKKYFDRCKYDWIVYADPDERWPEKLLLEIDNISQDQEIATISAPIDFYFKSYRLKGTRWGGTKVRGVAFHKNRIHLSDNVHRSKTTKEGFRNHHIADYDCTITHYWMSGYKELFRKHIRYLSWEGKSRYENGYRITIYGLFKVPISSFIDCFIYRKGYKDFFIGFFLSVFWSWYDTAASFELYKYQKKHSL